MTADILDVADRLWRGEVPIARFHPVGHSGALAGVAEICDGVAFVPAFGNVTSIRTADGLVLVDTGSEFAARTIHDELRRWDGAGCTPLFTRTATSITSLASRSGRLRQPSGTGRPRLSSRTREYHGASTGTG